MKKFLLLLIIPFLVCSCFEHERDAQYHQAFVYVEHTPNGSFEYKVAFYGSKHPTYRYSEYREENGFMNHVLTVDRYNGGPFNLKYQITIRSAHNLQFVRFEDYHYWAPEKYFCPGENTSQFTDSKRP